MAPLFILVLAYFAGATDGSANFSIFSMIENIDSWTPQHCNKSDTGECRWSGWSDCIWNSTREITETMMEALDTMADLGCKKLPKLLKPVAKKLLAEEVGFLDESPAFKTRYEKQTKECGNCGYRIRCCKTAKKANFFTQSLDGGKCTPPGTPAKACVQDPLTEEELRLHHEKFPDYDITNDTCDMEQFIPPDLKEDIPAEEGLIARFFCNLSGVNRLKITCRRIKDKCHCCCGIWQPNEAGLCVPIPKYQAPGYTCLRKSENPEGCDNTPNSVDIGANPAKGSST